MFEYAIGQNQKHPPSNRMLASWCVSIVCHAAAVLILYLYPGLLQRGRYFWEPVFTIPTIVEKKARDLGVSVAMEMPPIEEIKKYLPDWMGDKPKPKEQPAIVINLPLAPVNDSFPPAPKPVAPGPIAPPALPKTLPTTTTPPLTPEEIAAMTKKPDLPPVSRPQAETPGQIPKGITDPAGKNPGTGPTGGSGSPQTPPGLGGANPAQQISANFESDALGVNLQDYATLIKELIRQRWEIPSNLRDYQGSVTVTFTIHKDGKVTDSRILLSSGNQSLDLTALGALWFFSSNPLPPLPAAFTLDHLGARVVFQYNERR